MRPVVGDWVVAPPQMQRRWPAAIDSWLQGVLWNRIGAAPPALSADEWLDWQRAMAGHGLLPLLYRWLQDSREAFRPPAPVMTALQQAFLQQAALVAVRRQQLGLVLAILEEAVGQALVLKGAALAETLYPDAALRPAADMDLLVRPSEYPKARQALLNAGYQSRKGRRANQVDWAGEEEFVMSNKPNWFMVDLHWTLSPFTWAEEPDALDTLFRKARLTATGEGRTMVLALPHALIHAALHLVYANFDNMRLIWIHDIHLLSGQVEEQGLWPEVFSTARQWFGRLALVDALLLAHEWFGTALPTGLSDSAFFPAMEAEWTVFQIVHSSASTQEKLQRLRLANLSRAQRLSFYYDRLLPGSSEIDLNYPRFRKWPYLLKAIGRLATVLADRIKRG